MWDYTDGGHGGGERSEQEEFEEGRLRPRAVIAEAVGCHGRFVALSAAAPSEFVAAPSVSLGEPRSAGGPSS